MGKPEIIPTNKTTETPMHHVIAILAILVVGLSVRMFFFSSPTAEALNTTAATQARDIVNVRALENKLDIVAMPIQDILSEADPDPIDNSEPTTLPQ